MGLLEFVEPRKKRNLRFLESQPSKIISLQVILYSDPWLSSLADLDQTVCRRPQAHPDHWKLRGIQIAKQWPGRGAFHGVKMKKLLGLFGLVSGVFLLVVTCHMFLKRSSIRLSCFGILSYFAGKWVKFTGCPFLLFGPASTSSFKHGV